MCGCVADKAAEAEAKVRNRWNQKEADAKAAQEKADSGAVASDASPPPLPPPDQDPPEDDPATQTSFEPAPPDPMSFETLQEALVGALRVDMKQLKVLRKWWNALGLGNALPREPVEVAMDGDGSCLELSISVRSEVVLRILPTLLGLVPNAVPSPPNPHARQEKHLESDQFLRSAPPPPCEAPVRPLPRFQSEALLMAPTPDDPSGGGEALPTIVSGGNRPRGKAKAKSRVQRGDSEDTSGATASVTQSPNPEPITPAAASQVSSAPDTPPRKEPEVAPAARSQPSHAAQPSENDTELLRKASEPRSPESQPLAAATALPHQSHQLILPSPDEDIGIEDTLGMKQDQAKELPAREIVASQANVPPAMKRPSSEKVKVPVAESAPAFKFGKLDPAVDPIPGEYAPDTSSSVDYHEAAQLWKDALQIAIQELESKQVVLWLQFGGLGMPQNVARPVDVGVRIRATDRLTESFRIVEPYQDVIESLEDSGITAENGWAVTEMGCSLFAHGPLVLFSVERSDSQIQVRCDRLLERVVPASLQSSVKSIAYGKGIEAGVRAVHSNGGTSLGARFQFADAKAKVSGKELQSLAVDLALGKEKLFDAFLVERVRQMFASLGGSTEVSAIECRANDVALVTLQISPSSDDGQHGA